MTKFDIAFDHVIQNEGTEFVDDPTDKGGATKFGISEKFLGSLTISDLIPFVKRPKLPASFNITELFNYEESIEWKHRTYAFNPTHYIEDLTEDVAKLIYQKYFWLPIYDQIESQQICNFIFDMTVQHGKKKAAELTQRAVNACNEKHVLYVDSLFGNNTLSKINDKCITSCDGMNILKIALIAVRESLFRCIVAHDPTQAKFLEGWINRCYR